MEQVGLASGVDWREDLAPVRCWLDKSRDLAAGLDELVLLWRRAETLCRETKILILDCDLNLETSRRLLSRSHELIDDTSDRVIRSLQRIGCNDSKPRPYRLAGFEVQA